MSARKQSKPTNLDKARDEILVASLSHVAFDGWSAKALAAGAAAGGHGPTGLARAFPGGPKEAAAYFGVWADRLMEEAVGNRFRRARLRTHERIAEALRARLKALAPHREAVRRLLGFLALPGNAGVSAKMLWRSADAVWRLAGDTSTDFNYYTKRGMLAGVYAATLLFWLSDESEDFADTDVFLERRIADVMKFFALRGRMRGFVDGLAVAGRLKAAAERFAPKGPMGEGLQGPVRAVLRRAVRAREAFRRAG